MRARKTTLTLGALALASTPFVGLGAAQAIPPTCNGHEVTIDLTSIMMAPAEGRPDHDGTEGDDVILGTPVGEDIHGLGGDDIICAGGGSDLVTGDAGKDRIFGGSGNDELHQNGTEGGLLAGGVQNDTLVGNGGNDTLRGGPDNDTLVGYRGNDALDGGSGTTILAPSAAPGPSLPDTDDCNGGPGRDTEANCETSTNFP